MADIKTSLTDLIEICRGLELPFVQLLRPGRDQAEIIDLTKRLDLILPKELIELYEFCDGVEANGRTPEEVGLYYGYSIIPLREAIDEYRELQLEIITDGWDDIDQSWFPLLRLDSNFYFVNCNKAQIGEPYVITYSFDSGPTTMHQSIGSMVDTFTDYYREGAFIVEDGEVISSNPTLLAQIALRHNPNVAYWQGAQQRQQERQEFLHSL